MASAPRSRCTRDFFTVKHLLVVAKYPNAGKPDVLHGLLAVQLEEKTVSKKRQSCILLRHDDFDDGHLLHAVVRYC